MVYGVKSGFMTPKGIPVEKLLYKPEEAAAMLSVSRSRIFEFFADGSLKTVTIGRSRRVTATALAEYVNDLKPESTTK